MQMRTLFLVMLILVMIPGLYAQRGHIEGVVLDEHDSDPVEYAQVGLYQTRDSAFIDGTITDSTGAYRLEKVRNGNYYLEISFIGYKTVTLGPLTISQDSPRYVADAAGLSVNVSSLDEVTVIHQLDQTERKLDRQVYHADQFETASGGTAVDVLQNLPSVVVGPDGDVSLRGTSGFLVYLNGKPTQMEASVLLAQISANSIDEIEVITVPTAKYDSQGKGGIINITTQQSMLDGTHISTGLMIGGAPWNEKADPFRYSGNLSFTHQKDRLKLFGGLDYSSRDVRGSREGKARILQEDGSYYWMVADGPRPEWHVNHSVRLGVDYELTKRDNISAGFYTGKKIEGRYAGYIYDNFYGDIDENRLGDPRDIVIFNPNDHERVGLFTTASLDYVHKTTGGGTFQGSFLYESSDLYSDLYNADISLMEENMGDTLLAFRQHDDNPLKGYRFDLSYSQSFKEDHTFTVGYQPQYLEQQGIFKFDTLDVENQQWKPYTEFENNTELPAGSMPDL